MIYNDKEFNVGLNLCVPEKILLKQNGKIIKFKYYYKINLNFKKIFLFFILA